MTLQNSQAGPQRHREGTPANELSHPPLEPETSQLSSAVLKLHSEELDPDKSTTDSGTSTSTEEYTAEDSARRKDPKRASPSSKGLGRKQQHRATQKIKAPELKVTIENLGPRIMCREPRMIVDGVGRSRFSTADKPEVLGKLPTYIWEEFQGDLMQVWFKNRRENALIPSIALPANGGVILLALYFYTEMRLAAWGLIALSLTCAVYHSFVRRERTILVIEKHQPIFEMEGYNLEFIFKVGGAVANAVITENGTKEEETDLESSPSGENSEESEGDESRRPLPSGRAKSYILKKEKEKKNLDAIEEQKPNLWQDAGDFVRSATEYRTAPCEV